MCVYKHNRWQKQIWRQVIHLKLDLKFHDLYFKPDKIQMPREVKLEAESWKDYRLNGKPQSYTKQASVKL